MDLSLSLRYIHMDEGTHLQLNILDTELLVILVSLSLLGNLMAWFIYQLSFFDFVASVSRSCFALYNIRKTRLYLMHYTTQQLI